MNDSRADLSSAKRADHDAQHSAGWQTMDSAPRDGTPFLATVRVFTVTTPGTRSHTHDDTHLIYCDDETGEIHNDCEQGWRLEDYEFWMPLPPPPAIALATIPDQTGEGG